MDDSGVLNSTAAQAPSKNIELFTFDKNKKIQYQGYCRIAIYKAKQLLEIKTAESDEIIPLNREFIPHNNLLLILAPKIANDAALFFSKRDTCQKVYETIMNSKSSSDKIKIPSSCNDDNILQNNQNLVKERFASPLLDEICSNGNLRLKYILNDVMKVQPVIQTPTLKESNESQMNDSSLVNAKQEERQKEKSANLKIEERIASHLKPINLNTTSFDESGAGFLDSHNSIETQEKLPEYLSLVVDSSSVDFLDHDLIENYCDDKNASNVGKNKNIKFLDIEEFDIEPPNKKRKLDETLNTSLNTTAMQHNSESEILDISSDEFEKNSCKTENFQIRTSFKNGVQKYSLIVPNPGNQELCNRYAFNSRQKRFICYNCHGGHKKHVSATLLKDFGSGKFYIELDGKKHVCSVLPFTEANNDEKLLEIEKFEMLAKNCYTYKKIVPLATESLEDGDSILSDGSELDISFRSARYKNRADKPSFKNTKITSESFKLSENRVGVKNGKLEINFPNGKKYIYFMQNFNNYYCSKCKKYGLYVTAKLCADDDGEDSHILLGNADHICDAQTDESEEIPADRIIKEGYFKLLPNKNGIPGGKMEITMPQGNRYFYTRVYNKNYYCLKCRRYGDHVTAKMHENEEGENFVVLNKVEHICMPEINNMDSTINNDESIFDQTFGPDSDVPAERIIKAPNFKLSENRNGIPDSKMEVTLMNGRKYTYSRMNSSRMNKANFICGKCQNRGLYVNAKLRYQTNSHGEEEAYIILNENEHICESITNNFTTDLPSDRLIKYDSYKVMENRNGVPNARLEVTFPDGKKYSYKTNGKTLYVCGKCQARGINVTAKLFSNEENQEESYIILNENKHICNPIIINPSKPASFEDFAADKDISEERIIKKDNFKLSENKVGVSNSKLEITLQNGEKHVYSRIGKTNYICTKCQNKGSYVNAKLHPNGSLDEEAYVVLSEKQHICGGNIEKPKPLNINDFPKERIIKADNFKLYKNKKGIPASILELTMFDGKKYKYYRISKTSYYCIKCGNHGSTIGAKLYQDAENEEETFVLLGEKEHICGGLNESSKTVNLKNSEIPPERIIKNTNFILSENRKGVPFSKLTVTLPDKQNYVYSLIYKNTYSCMKCRTQGKHVTAKLCINDYDDGQEQQYLILNENKHVCHEFIQHEIPKTLLSLHAEDVPKTRLFSNFVLFPSSEGIPNGNLIIFDPNYFTKGYDFVLNMGLYKCNECLSKNKNATAKLIQTPNETENGEEGKQHFLELGHQEHICEYRNLAEQERVLKIRKIVEENPKEIIVPYFSDKKFCYKFIFNEALQVFYCKNCKKDGKNVWAKITKNQKDQTFFVLSSKHQCSPIFATELQT